MFGALRLSFLSGAIALAACASEQPASTPPSILLPNFTPTQPPDETLRASLGTVGVALVNAVPNQNVSKPFVKAEVGRAAASGAGAGALFALEAPLAGGGDPTGAVLWITLLPVLVPGAAIIGAGIGAVSESANAAANTIPAKVVEQMETTLRDALAKRELQSDLRRRVIAYAPDLTQHPDVPRGGPGDVTTEDGAATVLEIGVRSVDLVGKGGSDPELTLVLDASARLIRTSDESVLWSQDRVTALSASHKFSEWQAKDGALVQSALDGGIETLARRIDDKVFLEVWTQ